MLGALNCTTLMARNNFSQALAGARRFDGSRKTGAPRSGRPDKPLRPREPEDAGKHGQPRSVLVVENKAKEAEELFRAVIPKEVRILGAAHPSTLAARIGMANLMYDQGKFGEAETELRSILSIREKSLTPSHPELLRTCFTLGRTLNAQAKYAEALALMERATTGLKRPLEQKTPKSCRTG